MIYLLFFLSGAAALIYQVAWMKILTVEFGSTVYAVSTVLSVFMCGLAIGSWIFGRRVDSGNKPLVLYSVLEFLLGGYAVAFLFSIPLIHTAWIAIERAVQPSYESFSLFKLAMTFLVLLIPTTLMGGTLPVLGKYLGMQPRSRGKRLGLLYSFNTLGAMAGAAGISFVWILLFGVRGSVYLAAAINLVLGLMALWIHRTRGPFLDVAIEEDTQSVQEPLQSTPAVDRRLALFIAFVSGFFILACEVLWTRLFTNFLSGNALIFSTILIAVLAGLAIGGFIASLLGERIGRLQGPLGGSMLLGAILVAALVVGQSTIGGWFSAAYGSDNPYLPFLTLLGVLAIPSVVLGITFPVLLKWAGVSGATLGTDVGRLYAVNTVGSVLGSLVAGFVLIRAIGVNGSLLTLSVLYAAAALSLLTARPHRIAGAAVVVVLLVLLASPDVRRPRFWFNGGYTQLSEITADNTEYLEEGVTATVGIAKGGDLRHLTVNGVIVAETGMHDLWDLLSKAHLPMLIHPNPRRVALVGLGAGVSLGATERYDLDVLDCIEISPEVVGACRHFERYNQNALDDPRLSLRLNDARHLLMTEETRYDVINVDPVDPPICTLYTQDFFQVCHDRLDEGGLMVQWVPLFRLSPDNIKVIMNAFLNVFDHCTVWYNGTAALLIGRRGGPVTIDVDRFYRRATDPRVQRSLALVAYPDPWMLLSMYVGDAGKFREIFTEPIPENTDDRPYLEYTVLRSKEGMLPKEFWSLQMLTQLGGPIEDVVVPGTFSESHQAAYGRMRDINNAFLSARTLLMQGRQKEGADHLNAGIREFAVTPHELRYLQAFYAIGIE